MDAPKIAEENGRSQIDPDALKPSDVLRILRRQRWWIAGAIAPILLVTALYTFLQAPIYRAQTTLRIEEQQSSALPVLDILSQLARGAEVETEMEIVLSRRVAEGVVTELGLQAVIGHPRRIPRKRLFSALTVDTDAAGGRYRVNLERGEFSLEGPEGRVSSQYDTLIKLGSLTISADRAALALGISAIELSVVPFLEAVSALQEHLTVSRPQREASIIAVAYESTDPELARDVVNSASEHYLAFRNEMQKQRASAAVHFLRDQVSSLQLQLAEAESALETFRQENLLLQVETQVAEDVRRLAGLQAHRGELEIERTALTQLLLDLSQPSDKRPLWAEVAAFPTFLGNDAIGSLLERLVELETELSRLRSRRTEDDPDVQSLVSTINVLGARLEGLAESYLRALNQQVASLDATLAIFDEQLQRVPAIEVQYSRLRRNTDVLGELYTFLQTRLKEAEVSEAVEIANIQIVDPAVRPIEPVKPRKMVNGVVGILIGSLLALAVAFVRESLDTRVRTRDEIVEITGLPVLATVPRIPATDGRRSDAAARIEARLVTHHSPRSPAAEAYRTLRTNLTFSATGRGTPIKKLLFTSAEPQEGKSTTAANAAIALAEQGHRTLLIECDLRRPMLHKVFGLDRSPGLADVLAGQVHAEQVARTVPLTEHVEGILEIIPAGSSPPNPSELLGSTAMKEFLDSACGRYDKVILDTPPLNVVTDAAVVGTLADGVIIVTRQGATHREALRLACQALERVQVPVVGTVLNDVSLAEHGYGYGYRYAYRHYYGSDEEGS